MSTHARDKILEYYKNFIRVSLSMVQFFFFTSFQILKRQKKKKRKKITKVYNEQHERASTLHRKNDFSKMKKNLMAKKREHVVLFRRT